MIVVEVAKAIAPILFDLVLDIVRELFRGIGELFRVAWESRE